MLAKVCMGMRGRGGGIVDDIGEALNNRTDTNTDSRCEARSDRIWGALPLRKLCTQTCDCANLNGCEQAEFSV